MTLTPDSEPDDLFQALDAFFTGKFDATTSNHIWAAFRMGVEASQITPDEALTLSNLIVGTRLQPFYPELQKKLQAISEETKQREDA